MTHPLIARLNWLGWSISDFIKIVLLSGSKFPTPILHNGLSVLRTIDSGSIGSLHSRVHLEKARSLFDNYEKSGKDMVSFLKNEISDINLKYKVRTCPLVDESYYLPLYFICRHLKPSKVVETGVGYGTSTAYILQALEDNSHGELHSIDIPFSEYVNDAGSNIVQVTPDIGKMVPNHLKKRWNLIIGKTSVVLPELLQKLGTIDLFECDSEITYSTMMFEYKQAWDYLSPGGILWSNALHVNKAFSDFVTSSNITSFAYPSTKGVNAFFGVAVK